MISCLLNKKDKTTLQRMFVKKVRLQKEFLSDPTKEDAYIRQRNLIVQFVLKQLGSALHARVKTWALRKYCDEADASSLVYEHVLMAVDKYQPERGNCTFTSFLWTISNREFARFINRGNRQKRNPSTLQKSIHDNYLGENISTNFDLELPSYKSIKERFLVSLDESISSLDQMENVTLSDVISEPTQIDENLNFEILLNIINSKCTDQQKKIIALLQQKYTYKEIATQLGITPTNVSFQISKLRNKLKKDLKI